MLDRIFKSWELVQASAAVLREDKELLVLPLVSGICSIIVAAAFIAPAYFTGMLNEFVVESEGGGHPDAMLSTELFVWMMIFYFVQYFVIIFFNTALVGAALERLDGGNPTLGSAIGVAMGRIGAIAGYALISATVGLFLRYIGERFGIIGRIVESFIGVAWTVTTFLAIPVIAARGVGPIEAVKESASLLRKSWGENIIGNAGIGLAFSVVMIPIVFIGMMGASYLFNAPGGLALGVLVAAFTIVVTIALGIYAAALTGVYSAALYRYTTGQPTRGFDQSLLSDAFRPKK